MWGVDLKRKKCLVDSIEVIMGEKKGAGDFTRYDMRRYGYE
jgi:hypothetical protein